MARFEVQITQDGDNMMVRLVGTGDMDAARTLQRQLMPVVHRKGQVVVMDMTQLSYVTSVVLGIFFWLAGQLHAQGRVLRLAGMTAPVARVLETACAKRAMEVYGSVSEALTAPRTEPRA